MSEPSLEKLHELIHTIDDEHKQEVEKLWGKIRRLESKQGAIWQVLFGVEGIEDSPSMLKDVRWCKDKLKWYLPLMIGAVTVIIWFIEHFYKFG